MRASIDPASLGRAAERIWFERGNPLGWTVRTAVGSFESDDRMTWRSATARSRRNCGGRATADTCISRCSTGKRIWAGMTQTAGERPRPAVGFVTFVRRNFRSAWSPEMAKADPQRPFVHLDVQTAYSAGGTSPSLPEDYVRALARQHPLDARSSDAERIYLAIADYGLHSAVKTALACARAGIEHIAGLRVRIVAERGFRPWSEQPRELVLLAMDDVGWTNIVQLTNIGHPAVGRRDGQHASTLRIAGECSAVIAGFGEEPFARLCEAGAVVNEVVAVRDVAKDKRRLLAREVEYLMADDAT